MPVSQQLTAELILTNAQVIALPTTSVQIVAAVPGAVLWPLFAHARLEWVADYGNIDAGAVLQIRAGGTDTVLPLYQGLQSGVSGLLAGGGPDGSHAFFSPFLVGNGEAGGFGSYSNIYDSDVVNLPLTIQIDNAAAGILNGGNAGNSIGLQVVYMVLPI